MRHVRHKPPPPLSHLVSCLWYSEGFIGSHTHERLLPNGEAGIVFDLRHHQPIRVYDPRDVSRFNTYRSAVFCGPRDDCFVIDTSQQERVLGIQFHPGGAFPFFHMPASEISSGTFSLDDLWPGDTELIRERLISALDSPSHLSPRSNMHSNADQDRPIATLFSILENALLAQLARPLVLHPAVAFAVRSLAGACRVSEVVDRVGLSSRRFIEVFHHQIGLTPKVFQRVCRFQRALRTLHNGAAPDLADLALNCGYYDQPHFINDFRTFSGMTPLEYLTVATPHLNHVPLN